MTKSAKPKATEPCEGGSAASVRAKASGLYPNGRQLRLDDQLLKDIMVFGEQRHWNFNLAARVLLRRGLIATELQLTLDSPEADFGREPFEEVPK